MERSESLGLWLSILAGVLPIIAYQIYQSDRIAKLEAGRMQFERHMNLIGHPSMMQLMGGQQATLISMGERLTIIDSKLDRIIEGK